MASRCDEQRASALSSPAVRKTHLALVDAANNGLVDASASLSDIRTRTQTIIDQHVQSTAQLEQFLSSFQALNTLNAKLDAIEKCRRVADAYAGVLHPLNLHMRDGSLANIDSVAASIEKLIETVNAVRGKHALKVIKSANSKTNKSSDSRSSAGAEETDRDAGLKILSSVEKLAVDAVIKARAAFINVLDNEFRRFGWPMNVPVPGRDDKLIATVKAYVNQLNQLQRVSNDGDFIHERTKYRRAVSDNWAVAAILRTPLARFKYHFLEKFRAQTTSSSVSTPATASRNNDTSTTQTDNDSGVSRFDRPEWAAEFALERIRETSPFLSQIQIDGPQSTEVKFAEGFCRVFAEKIAYDCELAMRSSTKDSDADIIIAHASDTAKQFDSALREGVLSLRSKSTFAKSSSTSITGAEPGQNSPVSSPPFQSSLHMLSMDESFLTNWAQSELRLAFAQVNRLLEQALGKSRAEMYGANYGYADGDVNDKPKTPQQQQQQMVSSKEELERICIEIAGHVGAASHKARALDSGERVSTFLKLTETPLLQSIRGRLKDDVEQQEIDKIEVDEIRRWGRAALCARMLADALEDRSVDPFYLAQEHRLGQGFYDNEVTRLRTLYSSTCSLLSDEITAAFIDKVRSDYGRSTRFGEVWAPDAALVLTHDLSQPLVEPLTILTQSLSAVMEGVPCRLASSSIWRPIASKLDYFFFDEVILQCFVGATRNAMPAASEENGFLTAELCARMARQVASDVETFVAAFSVVSPNPDQFLPHSSECVAVLQLASNSLLLPSLGPSTNEGHDNDDDDLLDAIRHMATNSDDEDSRNRVEQMLESKFNAVHICARDALELIAISGHRSAIRLM